MAERHPTLHPACKLFPKLGETELQELADDIREHGLQNAIILLDGKVLDGQNRLSACRIAKVTPHFENWKGHGSPVEWVISQNLMRRQLTASQRAAIALEVLPLLEKEAKDRQRKSQGRGKKVAKNISNPGANGKASEAAARVVGANFRYIEIAKSVRAKAPELIEQIRLGQMTISEASWISDLSDKDRTSLLGEMNGDNFSDDTIRRWKAKRVPETRRRPKSVNRIKSTTLLLGDCRTKLKEIPSKSVDAIITDPIYPEVKREYGRISEADWLELMEVVIEESKRILKPTGSAVFILQPNYDKIGKMRLWLWKFMLRAAEEWNLVQDAYWWAIDTLPAAGTSRNHGLMRQSVKTCVWLGSPDCYRSQENVLWEPNEAHQARKWSDRALKNRPSGHTVRDGRTAQTSTLRGGSVPFNLLPLPNVNTNGAGGHPASTPYELAAWWCRYILPPKGVLLDMFCGSGTMLAAGLDNGASRVIGIEKQKNYLSIAKERVEADSV